MKSFVFKVLILHLLVAPLAWADGGSISGVVEAPSGLVIEHARVENETTGEARFTDGEGRFLWTGCPLPCRLVVQHPRFETELIEVQEVDQDLRIVLNPKQEVFEEIDVTASRGERQSFAPLSVASAKVKPQEQAASPTTLTELVETVAGVAENGQGGIFQVFSIRGVSRQRVLTLVSGIPIIGERRAGVSTSFIDPLLIGSVDILRGPFSTYYGSGALGGVAQVFPRIHRGLSVETGYNVFGDETWQAVGWGTGSDEDGWSLALAHRAMDEDEAAEGTRLNSHFTQVSAAIERHWTRGDNRWELLIIPTFGSDIGKPNSDFPERATDYPRERHLLLKLGMSSPKGISWNLYAHPNDLETEVLRVGQRLDTVLNQSFDFGGDWQRRWTVAQGEGRSGVNLRLGLSYQGRRGVDALEIREVFEDGFITENRSLDNGEQDETAIYGSIRWSWGAATFQAGSRLTWHRQAGSGAPSQDDSALTGFLGMVLPLGQGFELTANVGTGLRFPNLSERFFTGTTGRGQVIGNPGLDSESSLNSDLGLRWYSRRTYMSVQIFRLAIEDYIERIDLVDDTRTFVNLEDGTLEGLEIEGFYQWNEHWRFDWNGHLLSGESDTGANLADVPSDRFSVGLNYRRGPWEVRGQLQLRASKDDPGPGEIAIPSTQLLSAALRYQLTEQLALTLRGRNLLDEAYFNSADDKISPAPGRSLGLSLSWSTP